MSVSPDDIGFWARLNQGLNSGSLMSDPLIGLASGLLQAGGPSRMPTSLGQALGAGLQTGQQFQQAGLQNAMQRLMLGKTGAQLNWMMGNPNQPTDLPPQQTNNPQQSPGAVSGALSSLGLFSSPDQIQNALLSPQSTPNQQTPQIGLTSPVQDGIVDPSQDPTYQYYTQGARLGIPEAATLAGQRKDIIMGSPQYAAAVEAAKANVTPINVRQGGGVYIPGRGLVYQLPKLPTGATIDANGNVSMAPGSLPAIGKSEQAEAQGSLFGEPAEGVIPSGPNAGGKYQTTVGNLMYGNNGGMPPLTLLPPAQSGGMADAGKAATDRANEAIEGQKDAQQQIAQLGQLETDLSALGTGPGKETQLAVNKGIASVAGFFGIQGYANTSLTNAAAARKTLVAMTAPAVRAMGAREPYQMVNFIKEGMASISNPEDANAIVTGMYRGLAEYKNDTGKFAGIWLNQNNGAGFQPGQGAWDSAWQNKADVSAYILENLPPFERDAIFKQAASNPQLAMELKRAQASASYLIQNGYLRDPNENNNE